jgi:tRNA A-37 threonylcarbamoyl transferase component Bud32
LQRLRRMADLLAGFEPVIADLSAGATDYFGAAGAVLEPVRRVDGPFSSVLRVRVTAAGTASYAFIKVLKPRNESADELARIGRFLDREYRSTLSFHRSVAQDTEIGALRPIACLPQHRAMVTEEVPGEPLSDVLERAAEPSPALLAVARRVGRWVRAYQQSVATDAVVEFAERRSYLDDRLRALAGPILSAEERVSMLETFDTIVGEIGSATVPAVAIHADLTPANIIVGTDGRVTVLDFTMAKTGPSTHDLSHVYFHLGLRAARRRARAGMYAAVQDAMLGGYDPRLSAADPLFRLILWQHAVCHVAMLAERRIPVGGAAYRWFIRRRWQACVRLAATAAQRRSGAGTPAEA